MMQSNYRLFYCILLVAFISLLYSCRSQKELLPPYSVKKNTELQELGKGVKLYIIKKGPGELPSLDNQVIVHYQGRLKDGSVFDDSYERNQEATFPLNGLIEGWQIALPNVPVGSKIRLEIPPEAGYGERELKKIPPNSTLIFDIELIEIK